MAAKTEGRHADWCWSYGHDRRTDCRAMYECTVGRCLNLCVSAQSTDAGSQLSVCLRPWAGLAAIYCCRIWVPSFTQTWHLDGSPEVQFWFCHAGAGLVFRPATIAWHFIPEPFGGGTDHLFRLLLVQDAAPCASVCIENSPDTAQWFTGLCRRHAALSCLESGTGRPCGITS